MTEPRLIFNGIDGTSGRYLIPPMTEAELLANLRGRPRPEKTVQPKGFEGDVQDLAATGWGVIFPEQVDPALREALALLRCHRCRRAATADPRRYRELTYQRGETCRTFLERHGVSRGPVIPREMPYYLLLAGGPEQIPYDFQFQLDIPYAVGRLAFDTPEEAAHYAATVVEVETGGMPPRPSRAAFFGTANPDDGATALSSKLLVGPLAESFAEAAAGWQVETWLGEAATKERLGRLLGEEAPSLLFTASHGMGFQPDDPRQPKHQGALLCQDWPGPERWHGRIPEDQYLSAQDVPGEARLGGLIAFLFACFGAGTPEVDGFAIRNGAPLEVVRGRRLAEQPLVSPLPQRLLGHPRGGALAVIGHVDRVWTASFMSGSKAQLGVFETTLKRLLSGWPVGAAMRYFARQYGQLAADLMRVLQQAKLGEAVDPREVVELWTCHNDARSYVVLGDPAVRLQGVA